MTKFQSRPDGEDLRASIASQIEYNPVTGAFTWRVSKRGRGAIVGRPAGSLQPNGYMRAHVDGRKFYLHRLAVFLTFGRLDPDVEVDHINGDRADNRLSNLRVATSTENRRNNSGRPRQRKSAYKGVTQDPQTGSWYARLFHEGKQLHLGTFKHEIDAARAYRAAAIRLQGEFAKW